VHGGVGGSGGFIHKNQGLLQKPSPRVGPTTHVREAKALHSASTPRLCHDVPIRLYQG